MRRLILVTAAERRAIDAARAAGGAELMALTDDEARAVREARARRRTLLAVEPREAAAVLVARGSARVLVTVPAGDAGQIGRGGRVRVVQPEDEALIAARRSGRFAAELHSALCGRDERRC